MVCDYTAYTPLLITDTTRFVGRVGLNLTIHRPTQNGGYIIESEHKIQTDIMLALSKNGFTVFRSNAGKIRTENGQMIMLFPRGFPDLCGFRHSDGRFFCLEIKNEKGRLRPDQKLFAQFIKSFSVLYGVARSVDDALGIVGGD